jgi:hypothetical protein
LKVGELLGGLGLGEGQTTRHGQDAEELPCPHAFIVIGYLHHFIGGGVFCGGEVLAGLNRRLLIVPREFSLCLQRVSLRVQVQHRHRTIDKLCGVFPNPKSDFLPERLKMMVGRIA